jgi:hypothetical protein
MIPTPCKKLLTLYPRAFREQLGVSMEQTFNDLYNERKQKREPGLFGFVLEAFFETLKGILQEHVLLMTQGVPMRNSISNPTSAALLAFFLTLPS